MKTFFRLAIIGGAITCFLNIGRDMSLLSHTKCTPGYSLVIVLGDLKAISPKNSPNIDNSFNSQPEKGTLWITATLQSVEPTMRSPKQHWDTDHAMVHLIPAYRQKLKHCKPAVRTSKQWTSEAMEDLRACLDSTDWDMFMTASNSLDELTEAVTSYISFCEDCCIPTRTRVSYNNNKPWFTAKLRRLRLDKEATFRSGDRDRFKESKNRFSKAVREAK